MNCSEKEKSYFDIQNLINKVNVINSPFGKFLDVTKVSPEQRDRMLNLAKESIVLSDDEKSIIAFGKGGFLRASDAASIGKEYGETTDPRLKLKQAQRMAAGTAYHNMMEDAFSYVNEIKKTEVVDSNGVSRLRTAEELALEANQYIYNKYNDNLIQIEQFTDTPNPITISVKYSGDVFGDTFSYINFILDKIEQIAVLKGYTLDQVDFYPEQPTADFAANKAGTQDLLIVFPDNNGVIFDHKTHLRIDSSATNGPATMRYYGAYNKQQQIYMSGNSYFGLKTTDAFLMPILQIPSFDSFGQIEQSQTVVIKSVKSAGNAFLDEANMKPSKESYTPIAISTSITPIAELQDSVKAFNAMIESIRNKMNVRLRNKPHSMDVGWDVIVNNFEEWKDQFDIRYKTYRELFQGIAVNYDISKVFLILDNLQSTIATLTQNIYGDPTNNSTGLIDELQNSADNFEAFMTMIPEIQETFRQIDILTEELQGLNTFFSKDIIDNLSNLTKFLNYGSIPDAMANLFGQYFNSSSRSVNDLIMTMYYDPINGVWYSQRDGQNIIDRTTLTTVQITLSPNLLFNELYTKSIFEILEDGTYRINQLLVDEAGEMNSQFITELFKDLQTPSKILDFNGNSVFPQASGSYIRVISKNQIYLSNPDVNDNLGSLTPEIFFSSMVQSLASDFIQYASFFSGELDTLQKAKLDLTISGISREYLSSQDFEQADIKFRPMRIFEKLGVSSELINHPLYIMSTAIKAQMRYEKNRQADMWKEKLDTIFNEFATYQKSVGKMNAIDQLINRKTARFHARFTDEFKKKVIDAYANEDWKFIKDNFIIKDEDEFNKWFQKTVNDINLLETPNQQQMIANISLLTNDEAWGNPILKKFLIVNPDVYDSIATPEYNVIRKNKALNQVYELFYEFTNMARDIAGDGVVNVKNEEPFFPYFKSDFSEMLLNNPDGALSAIFKNTVDFLKDEMQRSPVDPVVGTSSAIGQFEQPRILFFGTFPLVPVTDQRIMTPEEIERNARLTSFELRSVANGFVYSMLQYEQLKLTEPIAHAMLSLIKSGRYKEITRDLGEIQQDPSGNLNIITGDNPKGTTFGEMFERWIYYDWYGIRYLDERRSPKDVKLWTGQRSTGQGPITAMTSIMFLKNMYSRNVLGFAIIPASAALIASIINGYINSTEMLAYSPKHFKQGLKMMFNSSARARMRAMSMHLDVFTTPVASLLKEEAKSVQSKAASDYILYGPLRLADMWITDIVTYSVLNYFGLDESGNVAELNKLPEGAKPIIELFQFNDSSGALKVDKAINAKVSEQLFQIITRAVRDTTGQLPEDQKMGLQFYFSGTLALTFSTWVPGIVYKRIGMATYDRYLDKILIGRYRGVWQAFGSPVAAEKNVKTLLYSIKDNLRFISGLLPFTKTPKANDERLYQMFLKWKANNPEEAKAASKNIKGDDIILNEEEQFAKYKEAVERAIRSAIIELRFSILMYLAVHTMRMDFDGDDEPLYQEFWPARQLYKVLAKTHTELIFLLDPRQITQLLNNPIPAAGIFKDAIRLIENTGDEVIDFITDRKDSRDQSPFGYYSRRFVPGLVQISRFVEFFDQDKENPYFK